MYSYKNNLSRLSFILLGFSLILSISHYFIENFLFGRNAESVALDNAVNKIKERKSVVQEFLDDSEQTLISIRELDGFNKFLEDNSKTDFMEDIFLSYTKSNKLFFQMRYIDKYGFEKVRIERENCQSIPFIVPKSKLQNKSHRYYFLNSKNKISQKVWFSAIDLNVEHKEIKKPCTMTLRAILPVKHNGEFEGILIINYFMNDFLQVLTKTPLYDMVLFNDNGEILYHNEKNQSLLTKNTLLKEYPDDYNKILSEDLFKTTHFISKKLDLPIFDGLNILLQLKKSYIEEEYKKSIFQYFYISVFILILSLMLTALIIYFFGRKLLNIDEIEKLKIKINNAYKIAKVGYLEYDVKKDAFEFSSGIYNIFEMNEQHDDLTYDRFLAHIYVGDRDRLEEEFLNSVNNKRNCFIEYKIQTQKENIKYIEQRVEHYFNDNGQHIYSIGIIYDVTDRYLYSKKYENIMDASSDGIHILDTNGNLIECSKSFADTLGYTQEEMIGMNLTQWNSNVSEEDVTENIRDLLYYPRVFDTKHKRKDGKLLNIEISAKSINIGSNTYLYATQRDITEEKKLLKKLEDSEFRWKFAINGNKDGLWDWNIQTDEVYFSDQWKEMLGYEPDEIKGFLYEWENRVHKDDLKDVYRSINKHFNDESEVYQSRYRMLCKDGSYKWILDRGMIVQKDEYGKASRMIGTHMDIDEEIKDQELIFAQKDELDKIFKIAHEGICIIDLDGNYIKFNEKYCEITGYSKDMLFSKKWFDMIDDGYKDEAKKIIEKVIEYGIYDDFKRVYTGSDSCEKSLVSSLVLMPNQKEILITTIVS
jgi:PAS domain S-box-containing protein